MLDSIALVPALPLAGFLFNLAFGSRLPRGVVAFGLIPELARRSVDAPSTTAGPGDRVVDAEPHIRRDRPKHEPP